jgi:cation transport ATPase
MSDLNHSVAPQGTQSKRKTFPDMVREYVVPYNSLLAVATFVCLMFGYLSPFALTTFAVMLVSRPCKSLKAL